MAKDMRSRLRANRRAILALAALALALGCMHAIAALPERGHFPGPVPARLVRVIDGDTVAVRARIWIDQDVETLVRLDGIDAPELRGRCPAERELAQKARQFTADMLGEGALMLRDMRLDKYGGRVLAHIANGGGQDLGAALLGAGLARLYGGAKRQPWC